MHTATERFDSVWAKALLALTLAAFALVMGVTTPALAADGTTGDGDGITSDEPNILDIDWLKSQLQALVNRALDTFGAYNDGTYDETLYDNYLTALGQAFNAIYEDTATWDDVVGAIDAVNAAMNDLYGDAMQSQAFANLQSTINLVQLAIPCVDQTANPDNVDIPGFGDESWSQLTSAYDAATSITSDSPLNAMIQADTKLQNSFYTVTDPQTNTVSAQLYVMANSTMGNIVSNAQVYDPKTLAAAETAAKEALALYGTEAPEPGTEDGEPYSTAFDNLVEALSSLQYSPEFAETFGTRNAIFMFVNTAYEVMVKPEYANADTATMRAFGDTLDKAVDDANDVDATLATLEEDGSAMVEALFNVQFAGEDPEPFETAFAFILDVATSMGDVNPGIADANWNDFVVLRRMAQSIADAAMPEDVVDIAMGISYLDAAFNQLFDVYPDEPVFRLVDGNGLHLYTTDPTEVEYQTTRGGWTSEGIAWYAPTNPAEGEQVVRLYNEASNLHYVCKASTTNQINWLTTHGWKLEGNAFLGSTAIDGQPIYQLYNKLNGEHLWTSSLNEYNVLSTQAGDVWSGEEITFYGAPLDPVVIP